MKNMRILIDINVALDWLQKREPFHTEAKQIVGAIIAKKIIGCLTAHTFPNLFYILRKDFDISKRKTLLLFLADRFEVLGEDKVHIIAALKNETWSDFEDGLQMITAKENDIDFIITRNLKDFINSEIPAISPKNFIENYM